MELIIKGFSSLKEPIEDVIFDFSFVKMDIEKYIFKMNIKRDEYELKIEEIYDINDHEMHQFIDLILFFKLLRKETNTFKDCSHVINKFEYKRKVRYCYSCHILDVFIYGSVNECLKIKDVVCLTFIKNLDGMPITFFMRKYFLNEIIDGMNKFISKYDEEQDSILNT